MVDLRINPDARIDELLPHWVEVFGVPETVFTPVWEAMGPERRFVAEARVDGQLVSTVVVYAFGAHMGSGSTVGMAGVANVATLEDHRGKGYSGELLKLAKAEMKGGYSLLFTGVPPHYAKVGYELVPEWSFSLDPVGQPVSPTDAPDKGAIEAIHAMSARLHPGSVVRDTDWWNRATWFRAESRKVWFCEGAYLFADYGEGKLNIIEAFGNEAELASLIHGAAAWAREDGADGTTSRVALPPSVTTQVREYIGGAMVLPLSLDRGAARACAATQGYGFLSIDHF